MLYRRFGRTELQMPVFSCGGMRYQYKWQDVPQEEIPQKNQENLEATIKKSVEIGINHIETARGYGTSEIQLGKILPKFNREELIVQTKVGPKADAKEFENTLEKSLDNLQLDYIDLLGIHGINNPETLHNTIRPGGCLDIARKFSVSKYHSTAEVSDGILQATSGIRTLINLIAIRSKQTSKHLSTNFGTKLFSLKSAQLMGRSGFAGLGKSHETSERSCINLSACGTKVQKLTTVCSFSKRTNGLTLHR